MAAPVRASWERARAQKGGTLGYHIMRQGWAALSRMQAIRPWTVEDARAQDNFALHCACWDTSRWLVATFNLTSEDAKAEDNKVMRAACCQGYLGIVQWLVATFGLTADDARARGDYALYYACKGGHLKTAQ